MKFLAHAFLFVLLGCLSAGLSAQMVDVIDFQQPAAGPVAPGSTDNAVLQFRVYKDSGSMASTMTQVRVAINGTATSSDWSNITLYHDADSSNDVSGGDIPLDNTSVTSAGKATFTGLSEPIQDTFGAGRDYLIAIDIDGTATADRTFSFVVDSTDVTASAGTVSTPFGSIQSNVHTVRIDNGCEMDVEESGNPVPSGTGGSYNVGFVDDQLGGTRTFTIFNTGTGTLNLTGSPIVAVSGQSNCAVTVTQDPATAINASSNDDFIISIDPTTTSAFFFTLTIQNNDFDEFPYVIQCTGSATPIPVMSVEYNSNPIANGGDLVEGSQTAAVGVSMVFTIINSGNANLDLTATPDEIEFPIANNVQCAMTAAPTNPVAQSSSTTFTIEYTPIGGGAFNFAIQIANNDASNNPYSIAVSGSAPAVTATELDVFRSPAGALATQTFGTQPIVVATDSTGAVDTSHNGTVVEVAITPGTGVMGASLSGTATATIVNGYATFSGLSIDTEGMGYTLTFTDQAGTLGSTVSQTFSVGPKPPDPGGNGGGGGGDDGDDDGGCSTGGGHQQWLLLCLIATVLAISLRAGRSAVSGIQN